ncbi:MAG: FecR domain-containing protein, partial [Deltaproteobacteria bacterium]|nr:FecR domain-containing protein [Deltaproteobacteria bacterium]
MILRAPLWRFCCTCFLAGLAVILLSGCIPPSSYPHQPSPPHQQPPSHQSDYPVVGNLHTDGPHVYYNHRRTSGGHPIRSGDNVSTRENSRATVRLINGSVVTIDQNTDPDFFKEAWCILVTIFRGQVSTDGSGICIETPHVYGLINSKVNIVVTDRETIITVLSGSVTMERPVHRTLQRHQQVRVSRGGIQSVRSLSDHQLKSVFQWRHSKPGRQRDPKTARCRRYAETAVSQQEENLRRGCRFKGNEWSANFNHHYNWCLQVPQSRADAGTRARAEALKHKC